MKWNINEELKEDEEFKLNVRANCHITRFRCVCSLTLIEFAFPNTKTNKTDIRFVVSSCYDFVT